MKVDFSRKTVTTVLFLISLFVMFALQPLIQYIIRPVILYNKMVSGTVQGMVYGVGKYGFEYQLSDHTDLDVYYFFDIPREDNLLIGDSINKTRNSFKIDIYRKDSNGEYVFYESKEKFPNLFSLWYFW